ncbi:MULTISPECIES: hypothetical protein [Pseudomonadaceae]|jgi:DNA-binding GntR family transcriptional regulator|uniref:Flagellar protein FliT n=2 Tax=Ectopseudomonas TaxID=3236654 RepID=A4XNP6_ECTM1|nr:MULTISPECIES: hypothetical protein [Pseudomonas]MBF8160338.1 hypothetical protein [Pseudomonas mendocina]MDH0099684.1 hypothetical protein [Pseudomonas sp. GD04158]USR40041.1 hypothetical protein L1F06_000975 [Pseudomonas hydrolytica]UTH31898.1 hypothetical protein NLY38_00910 [Pseudomonas hydrolytica]UZZ11075.1 hypothetical protein NDO41_00910 [Pseudomonas mendocina]
MPRASELRALQHLHGQLAEALEQGDWTRIGEIDALIRSCLQLLAGLPTLSDEVREAKRRLQQLHGQARIACAQECERVRQLLLRHLEYAEGRSAYLRVDQFQGGR